MTVLNKQKHNRPPKEFVEARNEILNNLLKYIDIVRSSVDKDGNEIHEFTVGYNTSTYLCDNLNNDTIYKTLKFEKSDFDSWVNVKAYNIAASMILHKKM